MQVNFEDLTDQEILFIELLFNEQANPEMDAEFAKREAGYPESVSVQKLLRKLKPALQDDTQNYLLSKAPLAARALTKVLNMDNPSPAADKVLSAAAQILDRAGISKKEKQEVEIKVPEGIVILPALNQTTNQ